jgi:N-acetylglucosaminyldiphosphoundecaprenol N-acetyl-beta-D-mannosaminyltransferase
MAQSEAIVRRARLLGAEMDLVTREGVIEFIGAAAAAEARAIVGNHNSHSLYLSRRDPDMRAFFEQADLIEIDSMPLVYWARVLGLPSSVENRCTYLDWRDAFWAMAAERNWRVFFLGAEPGVAETAARNMMQAWPGVRIETHHGYFDRTPRSAENQAVIDQINAFEPHVIMIGMGMPIQEQWVGQNAAAIHRGVILTVGAAFDYEAGEQGAAPRFLGALCLEWLYRLMMDPRRLSRRYLVEPWYLIGAALRDIESYILRPSRAPVGWRAFRMWNEPEPKTASAESLSGAA